MKSYRKISELEYFEAYRPSAAALAKAGARDYEPAETLSRRQLIVSWVCRLIAAAIMIETLFFKFTAAPESVYIFSRMGTEPWWRWGQGIWELLASICLLVPHLTWAGGILTVGAMGAAILSHFTWLGLAIQGDHGLLFGMAVTTFTFGFTVLLLHRHSIPFVTQGSGNSLSMNHRIQRRVLEDTEASSSAGLCVLQNSVLKFGSPRGQHGSWA